MKKLINLGLIVGLLSIGGSVAHGDCLKASGQSGGQEFLNSLYGNYKRKMECFEHIIIGYHLKHGISEENMQRLLAASKKIGKFGLIHESEANTRLYYTQGLVAYPQGPGEDDKRFEPYEEDDEHIATCKVCGDLEHVSYEEAFDRYIVILETIGKKCEEFNLKNSKRYDHSEL